MEGGYEEDASIRQSPRNMAKAALALLPTPSPEPSALVEPSPARDPHRRATRTSAPGPRGRCMNDTSRRNASSPTQAENRTSRQAGLDDAVDKVSLDVARAVVNMQDHYVSELEAERHRNDQLRQKCEALEMQVNMLERKGNAHAVLMHGFVDFMEQVKNGTFVKDVRHEGPEVEIARRMGGTYINRIRAITSDPESQLQPIPRRAESDLSNHHEVMGGEDVDNESYTDPEGTVSEDTGSQVDEPPEYMYRLLDKLDSTFDDIHERLEDIDRRLGSSDNDDTDRRLEGFDNDDVVQHDVDIPETTQFPGDEEYQAESPDTLVTFDRLPPTPDLTTFTAPLRSTGTRAVKRKTVPSAAQRKTKRRVEMTEQEIHEWKLDLAMRDLEYSHKDRELRFADRDPAADDGDEGVESQTVAGSSRRTLRTARWKAINDPFSDALSPAAGVPDNSKQDSDYEPESDEEIDDASTISAPRSPSPHEASPDEELEEEPNNEPQEPASKPRYSVSRKKGPRVASGPPGRPFQFQRMPKTVAGVWKEYKDGLHGNPAIEELEKMYDTGWRTGSIPDIKYGSNYVSIRRMVVREVEKMCAAEGITASQACARLDTRVDGRMQLLLTTLRKGKDPLTVIPRR
ncbi:hypothetical protein QQZ08_008563 [Neonectria magnoliae]|uniref:Transcription activator GCR1-like domain-containing protein n=1 Tax=Neonectria magnoliae TaxID=2732573 RepID=A0ABR1HTI1_9HYPO